MSLSSTSKYDGFFKKMNDHAVNLQNAFVDKKSSTFPLMSLFKNNLYKDLTEDQIKASKDYLLEFVGGFDEIIKIEEPKKNAIKEIINNKKKQQQQQSNQNQQKEISLEDLIKHFEALEKEYNSKPKNQQEAEYAVVLKQMIKMLQDIEKNKELFKDERMRQALKVIGIVVGLIMAAIILKSLKHADKIINPREKISSAASAAISKLTSYASQNPGKFTLLIGVTVLAAGAIKIIADKSVKSQGKSDKNTEIEDSKIVKAASELKESINKYSESRKIAQL